MLRIDQEKLEEAERLVRACLDPGADLTLADVHIDDRLVIDPAPYGAFGHPDAEPIPRLVLVLVESAALVLRGVRPVDAGQADNRPAPPADH